MGKNFKVTKGIFDIIGKNIDIGMFIGGMNFICKWNKKSFDCHIDGDEYQNRMESNKAYGKEIQATIKKMSPEELTEEEKEIAEEIIRYIMRYSDSEKVVEAMKKRFKNDCPNICKKMTEPEEVKQEAKAEEKVKTGEISENPNHFIKKIKKTMTITKKNKNK